MSGTDVAIEALGEVIAAYKKRIVELEAIVAQQQQDALAKSAPSPVNEPGPEP